MQKGTIVRHGRHWLLRYYEHRLKDGVRTLVKASYKLASVDSKPDKRTLEMMAWKFLEPINNRLQIPEAATPITEFIENVYFPAAKEFLRTSTYKGYRNAYEKHFKHRLGKLRLREFRTVHGQRLLAAISKDNPALGHRSLLHLKNFLSGVFKHARTEGYLDEENQMRDVTLPRTVRRSKFKGDTYTLPEITTLLANVYLDDYHSRVAFAAVATAAFTGLRLSEIRGLQWKDFQGDRLSVERTVWRTSQNLPKTESSENTVPVLPLLKSMLILYRHYLTGEEEGELGKTLKPTDWMFAGERKKASMYLPNLVKRTIVPNLTRCEVCHLPKHCHDEDHEFQLDESIPKWRGWHAFRRSLATNLYTLGVKPKVIQAILRHSDIATTLIYYVETPEEESRAALEKLMGLAPGSK